MGGVGEEQSQDVVFLGGELEAPPAYEECVKLCLVFIRKSAFLKNRIDQIYPFVIN